MNFCYPELMQDDRQNQVFFGGGFGSRRTTSLHARLGTFGKKAVM